MDFLKCHCSRWLSSRACHVDGKQGLGLRPPGWEHVPA